MNTPWMRIAFDALSGTDRLGMIAPAFTTPEGGIFLVHTNLGGKALGMFLDPARLQLKHPDFPECGAFYPDPIAVSDFNIWPAEVTGHSRSCANAALRSTLQTRS